MRLPESRELAVPTLGPCSFESPLSRFEQVTFVDESRRILAPSDTEELGQIVAGGEVPSFEAAGPRSGIHFDPESLTCGIVTCGGLCPGLNDVIRSLVRTLTFSYGVDRVLGFRYGYAGLARDPLVAPRLLKPVDIEQIHERGGTVLGSSRGRCDIGEMVDTLVRLDVGILFTIGGDGTLRGALALQEEIARRGLDIAVIGVPKTIDNDLRWTVRTFGFTTAVTEARDVIMAAHNEATGAWNGIGLVKLMGRHSGFIAAHAALANADVNYCLVPEVPFCLDGEGGFLEVLEERLRQHHHAVIVVAEGAGQEYLEEAGPAGTDASGNVKLRDIGVFLRDRINDHFSTGGIPVTVKYFDPSYAIRSLPANAFDSALCLALGQHAVHAGMAGKTGIMVGYWNQHFTHVPLGLAVGGRKQLEPQGHLWQHVLGCTGQPESLFKR